MKALLSLATALFFVVGHPLNAEAKGRSFESGSFGKPKTFMTYKKSGPMGNVYVGRTSGFGSRQSILAKRDNNHHMDERATARRRLIATQIIRRRSVVASSR